MNISSEQEMLAFGERFAKQFADGFSSTGGRAGGSPTARSRRASTVGEAARSGPVEKTIVIELIGDVGAGKTTFVRGLARGLGIRNKVTSPSYTISKTYALPHGGELIHYDFYRLEDPGLMANNLDEAIKDNSIVVVEWGKSVQNILPKNRITVSIKLQDDNSRKITIRNNCKVLSGDGSLRPVVTGEAPSSSVVTSGSPREVHLQLFLDTSTPETILKLNDHEYRHVFANDLAEKLLEFIKDKLTENSKTWQDITEIVFMSGPGSFTGLRIGASVVNTLAHELNIPLYDHHGKKRPIILPDYGRPANIGKPKK